MSALDPDGTRTAQLWSVVQSNRLARLNQLERAVRAGQPGAMDTFRQVAEAFLAQSRLQRLAELDQAQR